MAAGKRRAEPVRRGLPAWTWGVVLVAGVLLVAWFTLPLVLGDEPRTPSTSPTDVAPKTPTTPSASRTPGAAVTPPRTPANLPRLSPDQPHRLSIDGVLDVGFTVAVRATGRTLEPAARDEVSRWADRGSPGSPGEDTVVIVGTADPTDPDSAFRRLPEAKPGTRIRLRTDRGVLTYTVATVAGVPASGLLQHRAITTAQPGRLVLVAERYAPSGDRLTSDLVVVAVLTGATPA